MAATGRTLDASDGAPLFTAEDRGAAKRAGRPLTRQAVDKRLRRILEDAELWLKSISAHSLRHTFATRFLEGGAAVSDLQRVLGHRNLTTTQIYAHMVDSRTRASVEALDFGLDGVLGRDEMCYSMCSSRLEGGGAEGREIARKARGTGS